MLRVTKNSEEMPAARWSGSVLDQGRVARGNLTPGLPQNGA